MNAASQVVNSAVSGPGGTGGLLNARKGATEAQTAAQFGDVLKNIQSRYGAKAEKPREIKKTLGKDDFLRIMITQMQHQDPTNPFKAEQMAAEMAQFTSVEQLQNINHGLSRLAQSNQPIERLAMTGLIGKLVTVDRNRFAHVEGQNETLSFRLPKDASEAKLILVSEQGEVVLEKDLGSQKAGEVTFAWDGLKSNTLAAKSGGYIQRIEAKDERGAAIMADPQRRARVVGVSFEGGEPILLVGDNQRQEKITMKNVIRIENDVSAPGAPGAAQGVPQDAPAAPNFIAFRKGEGSGNLDPATAAPEVQAALAGYQASRQDQGATTAGRPATGFPNGLPSGLGDNGDVDTSDIEAQLTKGGEKR